MAKDKAPVVGGAQTVLLAHLRTDAAPLGDVERRAYSSLATDAQRSAKGAETKADKVLQAATTWAVIIAKAAKHLPVVAKHYAPARFSYFLDQAARLDTQIRLDDEQASGKAGAKSGVKTLHASGITVRDALVRKLSRYAGKRGELLTRISNATGTAETERELEAGLTHLADLTDEWLTQTVPEEVVLLQSAGLSAANAQRARDAAAALTSSEIASTIAGKGTSTDSLLAGIAEGGVLFEMEEAMHAFDDARAEDPAVPRLIPTGSIARALGINHTPTKAEKAAKAAKPAKASDKGTSSPK